MHDPALLWAVDDDAPGGIRPLPASPLLGPALVGAGLWNFGRWLTKDRTEYVAQWSKRPDCISEAAYFKDRHAYLVAVRANIEFPCPETLATLRRVDPPRWAPSGWKWIEAVPSYRVDKSRRID